MLLQQASAAFYRPMRLTTAFQTILGTSVLLAATACGGSGDADPAALIQQKDFAGAIALIEPALKAVEQGSDAHRDLLIMQAEALSADSPDKAAETFMASMKAHKDLIGPKDVKYVVDKMAEQKHLTQAIDVMDLGLKTWEKNETLAVVLDELKQAALAGDNADAVNKLKGMGYL